MFLFESKLYIYSGDPIIGGNEICSPETHGSYLKTFQSIDSGDNQLLLVAAAAARHPGEEIRTKRSDSMFAKIRQAILYKLMLLEYKRDVGRLTAEEIDKKWPIVDSQPKVQPL